MRGAAPVLQQGWYGRALALRSLRREGPAQAEREAAVTMPVCRCQECQELDRLPLHLQGIPGAHQLTFIVPGWAGATIPRSEAMPLPTFDDPGVRKACEARCEEFGDPACYKMNGQGPVDDPYDNSPCSDCMRDVGYEPGDEFDENAAVGRLL